MFHRSARNGRGSSQVFRPAIFAERVFDHTDFTANLFKIAVIASLTVMYIIGNDIVICDQRALVQFNKVA
jgi:hypothetical protein